jgi:hypothetical protein
MCRVQEGLFFCRVPFRVSLRVVRHDGIHKKKKRKKKKEKEKDSHHCHLEISMPPFGSVLAAFPRFRVFAFSR